MKDMYTYYQIVDEDNVEYYPKYVVQQMNLIDCDQPHVLLHSKHEIPLNSDLQEIIVL
jgi:hypothetical protein